MIYKQSLQRFPWRFQCVENPTFGSVLHIFINIINDCCNFNIWNMIFSHDNDWRSFIIDLRADLRFWIWLLIFTFSSLFEVLQLSKNSPHCLPDELFGITFNCGCLLRLWYIRYGNSNDVHHGFDEQSNISTINKSLPSSVTF